jgi:hypothetical protein
MNKKLLAAGIGSLAVAGMVGGTTFASWQDQVTLNASAGAETLTLDVTDAQTDSAATDWTNLELAPGTELESNYYVVSRSGDHTFADLSLTLDDLVGSEDGCQGAFEDSDQLAAFSSSCDGTNLAYDAAGQFIEHAKILVRVSDVVPASSTTCSYSHTPVELKLSAADGVKTSLLRDVDGDSIFDNDEKLGPDEKVCVNVQVRMPFTADNSSQGDSSTFKLVWDLEQVTGNPG